MHNNMRLVVLVVAGFVSMRISAAQDSLQPEVAAAAARGDTKALESLIARDRTAALAALQLVKTRSAPDSKSFNTAQEVLARNADARSFLELVKDLCFGEALPYARAREKIRYVGGSASVRVLTGLLGNSEGPRGDGDLVNLTRNQSAMVLLGALVPDPPVKGDINLIVDYKGSIDRWRSYLALHRTAQDISNDIYDWKHAIGDPQINAEPDLVLALGRVLVGTNLRDVQRQSEKAASRSAELRRAYQWVMARLGSQQAFSGLRAGLESQEPDEVRAAIAGLVYVDSPAALDSLYQFAEARQADGRDRQFAVLAIQALSQIEPFAPAYPRSVSELPDALAKWRAWRINNPR